MKEQFENWRPSHTTVVLLHAIIKIMDEYNSLGYKLSLRQLYYQLVSRDLVPNTVKEYARIGNIVSRGRLAGILDWSMIEDRVRIPKSNTHWKHPTEILEDAKKAFYMDHWVGQNYFLEVWSEKDAVSNILQPVCSRYDVTFIANRGYSSQTAMYNGSKRILDAWEEGKHIVILYFGDHDPSGMDMTRDIEDRLRTLFYTRPITDVDRVALNMDQIERFNPPENPAKVTDSRFREYAIQFGESSWELDAIDPVELSTLLESKILEFIDQDKWVAVHEQQEDYRDRIETVIDTWEKGE